MTRCWVMAIWSFSHSDRTSDTGHRTSDIRHASDFIFCPMLLCSALDRQLKWLMRSKNDVTYYVHGRWSFCPILRLRYVRCSCTGPHHLCQRLKPWALLRHRIYYIQKQYTHMYYLYCNCILYLYCSCTVVVQLYRAASPMSASETLSSTPSSDILHTDRHSTHVY